MSKNAIPFFIAIVLISLLIFLSNNLKNFDKNNPTPENNDKPQPNIIINTPKENDQIGLSIYLSGQARVFENTFTFRLKNLRTNKTYAESSTITDAQDSGIYGKFSFNLDFSGSSTNIKDNDPLLLEVFQYSPKDGSEIDKQSVNLTYKNLPKKEVKLFFINPKLSTSYNCEQSFPVTRGVEDKTDFTKNLIQILIIGPSDKEMAEGYNTKISPQTTITDFSNVNGTVKINLSDNLNSTNDCKIKSIKSQVTETLKQFSDVKQVILSINNQII